MSEHTSDAREREEGRRAMVANDVPLLGIPRVSS
jgi:hypothetical protein